MEFLYRHKAEKKTKPKVPSAIIELEGDDVYVDPAYVDIVHRTLDFLIRRGYIKLNRNVRVKNKS
jgi:hypothetical protein